MRGAWTTFKKELLSYACSPVSYLIAVLFYLWRGIETVSVTQAFAAFQYDTDLFPTAFYGFRSTFFMVLLVPGILTMRCFAEERRTGSIETLTTAPVRDHEIVLGKWGAAVAFYALLWLPTVLLLWVLTFDAFLASPLSFGPVFTAYLGLFLLSSMLLAFGCFASSLTDNVLLAAIVAILFDFALLQAPGEIAARVGDVQQSPYLATLLQQLDVMGNFGQWWARGLIDTSQIWFYAGGIAFFLFLCLLSFSTRRFQGTRRWFWLGNWANLVVAGALMLAVWALLIWVGSRPALKRLIDFSPQQRSSVDPVTEELLSELQQQGIEVQLHTFFQPPAGVAQDPVQVQWQNILGRVRELTATLLHQYDYLGGDQVTLRTHDPFGTDPRAKEVADRFGVEEADVVVVAVRQAGREWRHRRLSVIGDLSVVDLPQQQQRPAGMPGQIAVPVLKDFKGEEALSSALKSLLVQGTPKVYFVRGKSRDLGYSPVIGTNYGGLQQLLRESGFELGEIDLARAVPPDASIVAVLEPRYEFTEAEQSVLMAYLRRGGRLLLDYAYAATADWNVDGGGLGQTLGFRVGPRPVFHLIPDPRSNDPGLDGSRGVSKLSVVPNANHPITRRIFLGGQAIWLDEARPLELLEQETPGIRREPLLQTGPYAWIARIDSDGYPSYQAPRGGLGPYLVGAVIDVDGEQTAGEGAATGLAVVISGAFCNNAMLAINRPLVLNVFNWLAERRVLLDIQGSRYVARHLQVAPQQIQDIQTFVVFGVPGGLLLLGAFVAWRRRRY